MWNLNVAREFQVKHLGFELYAAACWQVKSGAWDEAGRLFIELNANRSGANLDARGVGMEGSLDVCFVMDCTGSMSSLIKVSFLHDFFQSFACRLET